MLDLLAWALAWLACAFGNGDYAPPAEFTDGMRDRGAPVVRSDFIGLAWWCDPAWPASSTNDEQCYAGLVYLPADATPDGAPAWTLETGP